ncbi:MAG: methyltransferase domain-containing protein [Thermaerobacter sp.]|nr:methyltransferase domain-containing protein [Thermaerobacter sp.]
MQELSVQAWMQANEQAAAELLPRLEGEQEVALLQGVLTHYPRLLTLSMLHLQPGDTVLDVGTGTGALALDLAWGLAGEGRVMAVDIDAAGLEAARLMAQRLRVPVETVRGDVHDLPFQAGTFDRTVARFLLQHLKDPAKALAEMVRVTRPGGTVAVIDVDDGSLLEDPPPPPKVAALYRAVAKLQAMRGGDRHIGRKLYRLFRATGLDNVSVVGIPRVQAGTPVDVRTTAVQAYHRRRLELERQALLEAKLLTEATYRAAMRAMDQLACEDRFAYEVEFLTTGTVPDFAKGAN